jgi:hypothetical protein
MPEVFNAYVAIDPSSVGQSPPAQGTRLLSGDAPGPLRGQANTLVASDTADNPHYN